MRRRRRGRLGYHGGLQQPRKLRRPQQLPQRLPGSATTAGTATRTPRPAATTAGPRDDSGTRHHRSRRRPVTTRRDAQRVRRHVPEGGPRGRDRGVHEGARRHDQLRRRRLRQGQQGVRRPGRRLRRHRRAVKDEDKADVKGGEFLYFPNVRGADHGVVQPRRRRRAAALPRHAREDLPGRDHEMERRRDQGGQPRREAARARDIVVAPLRRLGHDRRTSRSTSKAAAPERVEARSGSTRSSGPPTPRPATATAASRRSSRTRTARSATSTSPTRSPPGSTFAAVKNKAGKYVEPDARGVAAAAPAPGQRRADLLALNAAGADAYPITAQTWCIVYAKQADTAKGTALKALSTTCSPTVRSCPEIDFAPLPKSLQDKAIAQIDKIEIPA